MGKVRVAPKKFAPIPTLELAAAVLSVKISNMMKKELQLQELDEYFGTDGRVVLGYIANDTTAFKTFAANRVHMIQENSNVEQWKYIPSKENPADDASRGMNFQKFINVDRVLGSKVLVKATVIMGDKFSCGIIATRRSRIQERSENKQDCC